MEKQYYVYISANKRNGTLYIGVTSNLVQRVLLHKQGKGSQFTRKYNTDRLVYFEQYDDVGVAITREKQLKKWEREWKLNLIEGSNPMWEDLFYHL